MYTSSPGWSAPSWPNNTDKWTEGRRYFALDILARARTTPTTRPDRRRPNRPGDRRMNTNPVGAPVPDPEERAARNAALLADNIETDSFDDHGRPAPWPPTTSTNGPTSPRNPAPPNPGQPPF